jgi:glycosyltransferase involved in cell wall biosynthesis
MRGAALTLAHELARFDNWTPDVVFVSGMCDVAHFRTLARRSVGAAPVVTYFHETQLTYPTRSTSSDNSTYAIINWISAVASDLVIFNSEHHRATFFDSLPQFLAKMPEPRHDGNLSEVIARSLVLPVGIDLSWVSDQLPIRSPPRILWNHRWEYDKAPDVFASAVEQLVERNYEFELLLLGWRPRGGSPALQRIRQAAAGRIVYDGHAPVGEYRKLLRSSDVVVSASRHENFGVAVVEAIAAGSRPCLPDRLAYPELVPPRFHRDVLYGDGELVSALAATIDNPTDLHGLSEAMYRFSWNRVAPSYDKVLSELVDPK